jgi:hypothetical protein
VLLNDEKLNEFNDALSFTSGLTRKSFQIECFSGILQQCFYIPYVLAEFPDEDYTVLMGSFDAFSRNLFRSLIFNNNKR